MQQIILLLHVFVAMALVVLVLLQQGKGAQMGAAFGSGASQTIFGSQGSTSFLVKVTTFLAAIFFTTSLVLGYIVNQQVRQDPLQAMTNSVVNKKTPPSKSSAPLIPNAGVPLPAQSPQSNKQ